jgi:hypothetical protein
VGTGVGLGVIGVGGRLVAVLVGVDVGLGKPGTVGLGGGFVAVLVGKAVGEGDPTGGKVGVGVRTGEVGLGGCEVKVDVKTGVGLLVAEVG